MGCTRPTRIYFSFSIKIHTSTPPHLPDSRHANKHHLFMCSPPHLFTVFNFLFLFLLFYRFSDHVTHMDAALWCGWEPIIRAHHIGPGSSWVVVVYIHAHTRAYIHTCINTYIYTYVHSQSAKSSCIHLTQFEWFLFWELRETERTLHQFCLLRSFVRLTNMVEPDYHSGSLA